MRGFFIGKISYGILTIYCRKLRRARRCAMLVTGKIGKGGEGMKKEGKRITRWKTGTTKMQGAAYLREMAE